MAVTIESQPVVFTPSDNPVVWTFSSDKTAETNFVYLVQIYVDGVVVANEFVSPDNGIYGRIDISGYAASYCNTPKISDNLYDDAANYATVKIKVIERYGLTPSSEAEAESPIRFVWKAKMLDDDFIDWNNGMINEYIRLTPSFANFFTNSPNLTVRTDGEQIRVMHIAGVTGDVDYKIDLKDADGNSIADYEFTVNPSSYILIFNLTPQVIIDNSAITLEDFEDCVYYTLVSTNEIAATNPVSIYINREIKYNYAVRVHFLSTWGTIESFTFDLISRESGKVKSFGYRQGFGQWDGASFIFSKEQGVDVDYAKSVDKSLKMISNWISQTLQNYLCDNLYPSPLIYQQRDDLMIRRKLTATTYDKKIHENDQIFLEEVNLMLPTYNSATI